MATRIALALVLLVLAARESAGQIVFGRTLDRQTLGGVGDAHLRLERLGGDSLNTFADARGLYSFAAVRPGRHQIIADRLGYERVETAWFDVDQDERLNLDVLLTPRGIVLPAINVVVRAGLEPGRFGFERRCAMSNSYCLTRGSIELREARQAAEMFRGIDGIMVQWNPGGFRASGRGLTPCTLLSASCHHIVRMPGGVSQPCGRADLDERQLVQGYPAGGDMALG